MIPADPRVERAVLRGEGLFLEIGCGGCHVPALPLYQRGWLFVEPNPFNPPGNLRPGDAQDLRIDLTSRSLPLPRLTSERGVVWVPAYTDLKLHDITSGSTIRTASRSTSSRQRIVNVRGQPKHWPPR